MHILSDFLWSSQSTPFWSKAGKFWKANLVFWVGTSVSSIKFFKVTKKQSLCTMVVSTNAYRILFSRKLSGKFIIKIKTFDFIDSFFSQLLSFKQVRVFSYSLLISQQPCLWIVLETEYTSAAFLKGHEFGTKVKIWSLFLLFEIFNLSFIQSTR